MQAHQHSEPYRVPRAQVNEVYLNGSGNQHPPFQSEVMENIYYWYDGNVPYCTDGTSWQSLDDNFLHMNPSGHSHVDKYQGVHQLDEIQLVNIHHPIGPQESQHSYTLQLWEPPSQNSHDHTLAVTSPISPCTSLSSLHWSDSEPSPSPRRHHLDDAINSPPSTEPAHLPVPQTAPPAGAQHPPEAPGPRRPSLDPPAPDPLVRDVVGRRAPKQRRTTRAVQPLACFFCRGRKIACGPVANLGSGDRTCEPCARRRLVCEYPAESYRGRRSPGSKTASVRSQRRQAVHALSA